MNLKKIKILAVIGIFILSFLSHFAYEIFPNIIFSFIFPVNESIWEHMKILFTSTLLYGIIDYLLLKKYNINYETHTSLKSLIFEIEEILNYETDLEDLEQLSEELEEMSYYNYTNK